jgi:ABC-type antimicrobial peptide transport system permease subunit
VTEDISFYPLEIDAFSNDALIYVYEPIQDYVFVKVEPGTSAAQLSAIEDVFHKFNPGYELEYDFVSNYNYAMLGNADAIKFLFRLFSGIAIFIAVMGLIGLSQFNNSRRTKEMCIHKVMGAHSTSVINLLLSEFIRLVILSNLLALPLAYLVLWRIFKFFSYSTELKIPIFLLVFLLSVIISLATVLFHAWKTIRANPANSLRYE